MPASSAKPRLRRIRPLPSGPVSDRRTSANAPFSAGRASTTYVRPSTSTLAETGTPASARSASASVSAVATGPVPGRAPGEQHDVDALRLQRLDELARRRRLPRRAGVADQRGVGQLGRDDVGLLGQHGLRRLAGGLGDQPQRDDGRDRHRHQRDGEAAGRHPPGQRPAHQGRSAA